VVPLLDQLTPAAQAIGAVNTIYLREGRAVGDNTDFAGFLADLLRWTGVPRTAVVLGTGGAARAVVYALGTMGCQVSVAARRTNAAASLCRNFAHASPVALRPEALQAISADLLVNATPAGMLPEVEACPWPGGLPLPAEAAVYDLVYNPPETRLMRQARAAGLRATNGLGMLIEQAGLSFELWTGCLAAKHSMLEAIGQAAR
jgi:shikimate dehydrogenase